jgi:transposase
LRGRREFLNGILFIVRTGAPWADLPERHPPYQTYHRRFQQWVRSGIMGGVLEALAEDLRSRGGFDPEEAFIDGSFLLQKRGTRRGQKQAQTAMVFRSRFAQKARCHTK